MSAGHDTVGETGEIALAALRAVRTSGSRPGNRKWRSALVRAVVLVDLVVIVAICATAVLVSGIYSPHRGPATAWSAVAAALALLLMAASRCWDDQTVGQGAEEFNRVVRSYASASLVLAFGGFMVDAQSARPWVIGVLPATGVAVLVERYCIRRVLHASRRKGACMSSVLVIGDDRGAADMVARTLRVPHHGWVVVAACTPTGRPDDDAATRPALGVPVVGDLDSVAARVRELQVDVVAVTPTPGWSARRLQSLAWDLEGSGVDLVVDPGLMEIGGPRLHVAPVDGLPMLRLTEPRFDGVTQTVKNVVDRVAAGLLLVMLSPVFLGIAMLVKRDRGPVFYWQERMGLNGARFRMMKFRTMVVGAEQQAEHLIVKDDGAGPLFKLRADPRVTRVGSLLRRHSLDELPQLMNVLGGSMSLVGPRPPLAREVAGYAADARRKFLVRPGMTGLWQVSGRSDLTWEESVRLDLRYVENWSPALDATILWKTLGAVVSGRGAY